MAHHSTLSYFPFCLDRRRVGQGRNSTSRALQKGMGSLLILVTIAWSVDVGIAALSPNNATVERPFEIAII